jgi:hypothetical protein
MGSGRLALQGDRRSRPPLPEPGAEGAGSPTALSAGGEGDASGCDPRFHAEAVVDPREARRRLRGATNEDEDMFGGSVEPASRLR